MRVVVWLLFALVAASAHAVPPIELYAAPQLKSATQRVRAVSPAKIARVAEVTGDDSTAPIRVVLAQTSSSYARSAPVWAAGYALPHDGVIVLFPERNPSYPDDSLEETYLHEIAHVMIARAGGNGIPRWFHEGLATVIDRQWSLEDWSVFAIESFVRGETSYAALDSMFSRDAASARQAYVHSSRFVLDLMQIYGADTPRRILDRTARGEKFDEAFFHETLLTPQSAWTKFWSRQTVASRAIPLLTSSVILWLVIVAVALIAFRASRLRAEQRVAEWDREEAALAETEPSDSAEGEADRRNDETVH